MAEVGPLRIEVPYKPRNWAVRLHGSFCRFGVCLLHRRAGKTTAVLNHHQRAAMDDDWERDRLLFLRPDLTPAQLEELVHPPGGRHYGHIMPKRNQAKLVAWDRLKYYAGCIPGVKFNEQELLVRYPNGNKVQLFGADDPDSFRGLGPSGVSFDEYSQQPAGIFSEVISKALADHLGYALFVGTVKGKDHLYRTWDANKADPEWLAMWQDIDRSLATEDGITIQLLETAMADDRKLVAKGLMSQDEFDQEWYLSVDAAIQGAYYGKEMALALKENRIARVPPDAALPVDTDWDLGMDDSTAIVFSQSLRSGEVRIIDYEEHNGEGLAFYVKLLAAKPYVYGKHYPPHDIAVRELGTGKSRKDVAASLGLKFEAPEPPLEVADGIEAARSLLTRVWFDAEKANGLVECLRNYRKAWDPKNEVFKAQPVHNGFSHGADAFRGLAVRWRAPREIQRQRAPKMPTNWAGM